MLLPGGQAGEVRGARETGGPEERRFDELAYRRRDCRDCRGVWGEEEDGASGEVGGPVSLIR